MPFSLWPWNISYFPHKTTALALRDCTALVPCLVKCFIHALHFSICTTPLHLLYLGKLLCSKFCLLGTFFPLTEAGLKIST